jgi:hypothetical protein
MRRRRYFDAGACFACVRVVRQRPATSDALHNGSRRREENVRHGHLRRALNQWVSSHSRRATSGSQGAACDLHRRRRSGGSVKMDNGHRIECHADARNRNVDCSAGMRLPGDTSHCLNSRAALACDNWQVPSDRFVTDVSLRQAFRVIRRPATRRRSPQRLARSAKRQRLAGIRRSWKG